MSLEEKLNSIKKFSDGVFEGVRNLFIMTSVIMAIDDLLSTLKCGVS